MNCQETHLQRLGVARWVDDGWGLPSPPQLGYVTGCPAGIHHCYLRAQQGPCDRKKYGEAILL